MVKNIAAILFLCAGTLAAQAGGEKVNVPLDDPSRPVRVNVHLLMGSITVQGSSTNQVTVETRPASGHPQTKVPPNAAGMHRLDLQGNAGLDITEQDNVVHIRTTGWNRELSLVITVPQHSSVQLKTTSGGSIDVEHVDGEIDADVLSGSIALKDVGGSVLAHALNGAIAATLDQVDPSKPMSFSTLNGDIDVTLPDRVKANVRMKTDNGEIYSDFDVKLDSGSRVETTGSEHREHGMYHIRLDRTLTGTINGGGPEYRFTTFNGQIFIRKQK